MQRLHVWTKFTGDEWRDEAKRDRTAFQKSNDSGPVGVTESLNYTHSDSLKRNRGHWKTCISVNRSMTAGSKSCECKTSIIVRLQLAGWTIHEKNMFKRLLGLDKPVTIHW